MGVAATLLAAGLATALAQAPTSPAPYRPELPLGLDLYLPVPEDNPLTEEKVALGRRLFFDPILSRDYTLSCGSCHDPRRAFTDGLAVAVGIESRQGTRNSPALLNRAWGKAQFWDGRAASLEEQALQPIENPNEFNMTLEEILARLQNHHQYPEWFRAVFRREVNSEDLGRAIASYLRTILTGNAPMDHYLNGDRQALSEQARAGLRLFRGRANCTACHLGPTFTDEQFHNTGVAWRDGVFSDSGRYTITGRDEDLGAFKTPTLREIARTAPYMHDGSIATLEDVVEFYDRGGNKNPYLDGDIRTLNLTDQDKNALLSFLKALSGEIREGL